MRDIHAGAVNARWRFVASQPGGQPPAPSPRFLTRKGPGAGPDKEDDMKLLIATVLVLATMPALADFSFRFGDAVVATGDSPGTVIRKAGREPDRIVRLENRRGAAVGERWEYYLDDKQVNFEIRSGRVVDIQELR
jgi:hypothetical protein